MSAVTIPLPLAVTAAAEAMALAAAATKGPWRWRNCHGGKPELVHPGSGLLLVMDAVRSGMGSGAEIRFAVRSDDLGGLMHKASALLPATGVRVPDYPEVTHPDMAMVAASRTLVARLAALVTALAERLAVAENVLVEIGRGRTPGDAVAGQNHAYEICAGRVCSIARDAVEALRAPLVIEEGQ